MKVEVDVDLNKIDYDKIEKKLRKPNLIIKKSTTPIF